jgi:hypothetical protein
MSVRWVIETEEKTRYGEWGRSRKEGETAGIIGVKEARIEVKLPDGRITVMARVSGEEYLKFSWLCLAYQYSKPSMNVALCLETTAGDYIVTPDAKLRFKSKENK